MKLTGLGKLYTMLYNDRMDIYRTGVEVNSDGTTEVSYQGSLIYENVKCRISFSSDDTGADSEVDRNPVRFNPKLFCTADVDLQAGDYVVVRRYADNGSVMRTYQGMVAMPSWYTTHQEAFMRIDEGA